jgi:hypothetical protein
VSWAWLALVEERPDDADAVAQLGGADSGFLAAWVRRAKPVREARRVDARIVDPDGEPALVSLVLPPPGVRLLFDDPAVQQARRRVLAGPPFDAVSTLLRDSSHFEGAVTVARGGDEARLRWEDPFALVFPARLLRVGGGLFGRVPAPAGPTIERYGSEQPWPWDRFEDATVA